MLVGLGLLLRGHKRGKLLLDLFFLFLVIPSLLGIKLIEAKFQTSSCIFFRMTRVSTANFWGIETMTVLSNSF